MTFSITLADSAGHMSGWGGGMFFGWIFMVLLLIGAGALVFTLVRGTQPRRNESSALDVLDSRYARGEIGRDEYLERRTDLER